MKFLTLTAVLAGVAFAGAAQAQTVAALVGDDTLAIVDAGKRKVERTVKVTGLPGRLAGIDVRPADGMLYGLAEDGTVVTIDPMSGKATQKSKLETMLAPGTMATVDFNPAADRLRVIGADGTNLRANVDDGKVTKDGALKFAEADAMKGKTPKVVAGAYTNSVKGAKETVLYDIDAAGALLRQVPPNDGVLNTIGMVGVPTERAAFDIAPDGNGGNNAYLMAGPTLYKVDLASGKATEAGRIEGVGEVRDIAVMPSAM
jgi:DNA-binding beta-propeller fold protein YncE